MKFFDLIRNALRNLWRRKLRTFLTVIAVFVGTLAVVSLVSLALGAQNVFLGQLEKAGIMNQVTVLPSADAEVSFFGRGDSADEEGGVKLDQTIIEKVEKINNVVAVTPQTRVEPIDKMRLQGQDKKLWADATSIKANKAGEQTLQAGRNFTSDDETNKIILGSGFLKPFGIENAEEAIGKKVIFTTWEGYRNIDMELPPQDAPEEEWKKKTEITAEIIGVGIPGPGERTVYFTDGWARRLMTEKHYGETTEEEMKRVEALREEIEAQSRYREISEDEWPQPQPAIIIEDRIEEKGYNNLVALVNNAENVETVAEDIKKLGVGAITAKQFLEDILRLFLIIQIVLGAIGGIALAVASIGIINTMVMSVMERTREIGVMKAVGASRGNIRSLFTMEAGLIGFWGGVLGVAGGWGLGQLVNYIAARFLSEQSFAIESIIIFPWYLIIGTVVFATFVGLLAGLYPAAKAARLDPVEALRRE